ncbi:MAG: TerB family tellurite resistance protein [Hyphomonadaceae bacterium]
MLAFLSKIFAHSPKTPAHKQIEPEVAAAALLVEAALADGIYADIESDQIAMILLESFDFDAARADAVLAQGEALAEEAVDAHQFTKHIKKLPDDQRIAILEGLYLVAFADGEKCPIEDAFIRKVAGLLHIADVPRAGAKKRAKARAAANLS